MGTAVGSAALAIGVSAVKAAIDDQKETALLEQAVRNYTGASKEQVDAVNNLGHKIGNGDWVTSIEGKTIILDDPEGAEADFSNIVIKFYLLFQSALAHSLIFLAFHHLSNHQLQ